MNLSNVIMTGITLKGSDPFDPYHGPTWTAENYFMRVTWYDFNDYLGVIRPCYKLLVREHMALDKVDTLKWPYDNYEFI